MDKLLSIEKAAKIGYEHSMKQLDKVYPETVGMFKWPTENEECEKEWLEKAELMLADTMRENECLRKALEFYADYTSYYENECDERMDCLHFCSAAQDYGQRAKKALSNKESDD